MLHTKWAVIGTTVLIILANCPASWGQQPAAEPAAQYRPLSKPCRGRLGLRQIGGGRLGRASPLPVHLPRVGRNFSIGPRSRASCRSPRRVIAVLSAAYDKLASGYEGLELKWFANLPGLGRLSGRGRFVGNAQLKTTVDDQIEALEKEIKSLGPKPTTEQIRTIDGHIVWCAKWRGKRPNWFSPFATAFPHRTFRFTSASNSRVGIGGPVDETEPVSDVILDDPIHGTGRTVGATSPRCLPIRTSPPSTPTCRASITATPSAATAPFASLPPAHTGLAAIKRFWIDETGIHTYPATARQTRPRRSTTSSPSRAGTRGKNCLGRADKRKSEAEAIASQHAAWRLGALTPKSIHKYRTPTNASRPRSTCRWTNGGPIRESWVSPRSPRV